MRGSRRYGHVPAVPLLLAFAALVCGSLPAAGQANPDVPPDLQGVGITNRLNEQIPLDLEFVDENGDPVVLGQYFNQGRPVLLTLVYFRCPMLCTLVLDGMVDALRPLDQLPGEQFEMVSVSIDPTEKPTMARFKKQNYVSSYGKPEAADGWHFLTGREEQIRALADAVGFGYRKVEETGEYAHTAALFVLTPEGKLSRVLMGVQHAPQTLKLSLVEASEGKTGSALDKFILYCYRYNAEEGRYAPVAMRIMQVGGGLAALLLGAVLLVFWLREIRHKRLA